MVASAFANTSYVEESLILYRQHGTNDAGARRWNLKFILGRIIYERYVLQSLQKIFVQAEDFRKKYKNILDTEVLKILDVFLFIPKLITFLGLK